jgi:hypothetical protein
LRLGILGNYPIEPDRVGNNHSVDSNPAGVKPSCVLGWEDNGVDVLESAPIVVAEVLQMENNGRALGPRLDHERTADWMPAVSQKNLGPEAIEHRSRQVEVHGALTRVRCLIGAAGRCGQERDAYAVEIQIEDLSLAAKAERRARPCGRPLDRSQNILDGCFVLVIEHAASERSAVPLAACQQCEQFTRRKSSPARRVEVSVNGSEESAVRHVGPPREQRINM